MYQLFNGGYGLSHPAGFHLSRPTGIPNYLLLIIKSSGYFHIKGKAYEVTSPSGLIIEPNTSYYYGNKTTTYLNDFLHFNGDPVGIAELNKLDFPLNEPFPLHNLTRFNLYMQQVLWEYYYSKGSLGESNVSHLLSVILNNLSLASNIEIHPMSNHRYYQDFQALRLDLLSTPEQDHQALTLSLDMGMSLSHFQHLYTSFFNVSFQNDLIRMRVEKAKQILCSTDFTMEVIADQCGYRNDIHFYRQFKKLTGVTPSEFRKLFIEGGLNRF